MCCNFENWDAVDPASNLDCRVSRRQIKELVDELILSANIIVADPAHLSLANHVYSLIAGKRSPPGAELTKALLGLNSSFDRAMILLEDIVQILDRSMTATAAKNPFFFHARNRRAVETGLVGVDDAGLRM